jgi:glycine dehydrogenase subunit 2
MAVLNANYVKACLEEYYEVPVKGAIMHEVVFNGLKSKKATTLDVAKRLLDYGFHPSTIYFPLLFSQSMMVEPVETEPKETIDEFIDALIKIAHEAEENPELLHNAPHTTPVRRLDEVLAARELKVKYRDLL